MKNLFEAGKLLFLDMAATLFFLVLYLLTHNVTLSVLLGMGFFSRQGWGYLSDRMGGLLPRSHRTTTWCRRVRSPTIRPAIV